MRQRLVLLFTISILFILIIIPQYSLAKHLVGGSMSYQCLGRNAANLNVYEITVELYRDCETGQTPFDDTIHVKIFNAANNSEVLGFRMDFAGENLIPLEVADTCVAAPTNICYSRTVYVGQVGLPDNSEGYVVSWERCCRNGSIKNIVNPLDEGMVLTAQIPNTALCNSSPTFNELAPVFICVLDPFGFDHSATDPDGDQLVYALTTPFSGGTPQEPAPMSDPPPYDMVTWQPPFGLSDVIGGNPTMDINSNTGILTARPDELGQYVVSVSVYEYRNGQLLSEVKRDMQLNVINCPINFPPEISFAENNISGDTLIFYAGEDNCIGVNVEDVNGAGVGIDMVEVSATGGIFAGGGGTPPFATFQSASGLAPISSEICWQPSCDQVGAIEQISFAASDDNDCPGPNAVTKNMYVRVAASSVQAPELRCVSVESPTEVRLTWTEVGSIVEGFESYEVYRLDGTTWISLASISNPATNTYTDNGVIGADRQSYCYHIRMVQTCPTRSESAPSNTVCSMVAQAQATSETQALIRWSPWEAWDNVNYSLISDNAGIGNIANALTDTSYFYTNCEYTGRFRVRVTDPVTGCESYSGYTEVVELENTPISAVELCRVSVDSANHVQVDWSASTATDLEVYRLYRKERGSGSFSLVFETNDANITSYVDTDIDPSEKGYCYQLEVIDICGVTKRSGEDCSIFLEASGEDQKIQLEWQPYQGWSLGVSGYEIWYSEDGIPTQQVDAVSNGIQTFRDEGIVENKARFCYKIKAVEENGGCGVEAWSNEECVSFPPLLYIPNAFTPNNDGKNDFFEVKGGFLAEYKISIFNRWGTLIYQSGSLYSPWDGKYNGETAPEGVYVFLIEVIDGEGKDFRRSGSVMLLR